MQNRAADIVTMEVSAKVMISVPFVGDESMRSKAPLTRPAADRTGLHQSLSLTHIAGLTGCEGKGDQSARPITPNMDFGAKSTA